MNETNERKIGAVLSYVGIVLNMLIQLLYTPLLIRMLGQSEYGLYSLVSSVIGYLTVLDFGFGNALIVYTAKFRAEGKYEEEKRLQGMFFVIFIIIGFVAGLMGLVLYTLVPTIFGETLTLAELEKMKVMMLILAFNLVVTFSFSIYSSIIGAYEKFVFQKIMSILNSLLKPLIMIPLLFMGFKSIVMTVVITVVNIIVVFSNYLYCKNKLNTQIKFLGFDKNLFKTIFKYSFYIFLAIIVDKVNWSLDQFILGSVCGTIAVSIYSVAGQLNSLFMNLSTAMSGVMLPKMTKMVAANADGEELTDEMIKLGRLQCYIIALMVTGLILFGKDFIYLWAGEGFEESYYVALLLIIPVCFPLVQNLGISIMQAMNKHKFRSIAAFVTAILNGFISFFLAKKFGATGAAMGTAISLIVCNVILINIYYYLSIKINVFRFWKNIIRVVLPAAIPISIALMFVSMAETSGLVGFIVHRGTYTILYMVTMYTLSMNSYEKGLIKSFVKVLKRS